MSPRVTKLLLPFAFSAEDREKAFTKEMELAAVFCLTESEREKGEGLLLKRPAEELIFIAEVCYPVWLAPWRGRRLLFDGVGATVHTISHDLLPDIKAFINDIQGSAETCEAYSAALSDNLSYFKGFAGKEEKTIEGLIASPDLVQDFISFLPEAKEIKKPILDKAFLSPIIDESEIASYIQELSNLRTTMAEDIRDLRESMKMLSVTTSEHVRALHEESRGVRKEFNEKIASVKTSVMKTVRGVQRKYDQKITTLSKKFDQRLHSLHQERVKLEKTRQHLTAKIERCEADITSCRLRKDEAGEQRRRQEIKEIKRERSILERSIKNMDKRIEDTEAAKKQEISKLRLEFNVQAEEAMKELREIEASRDAKIQMNLQKIQLLEDLTSTIVGLIDKLMRLKRAALHELDGMGISKRQRRYVLLYLPLYFSCYQKELKKRYVLYPPSVAGSMGILTRFKGVFGVAKIKSLLQSRSKPLTSLLNRLVTIVEHDPVFEREVNDAGIRVNILRTKESRERIKKGLEALKDEGWVSETEFQAFSDLLTKA